MLYRLRTEQLNGKNFYSAPVLVGFPSGSPVRIYPAIINGNIVNIKRRLAGRTGTDRVRKRDTGIFKSDRRQKRLFQHRYSILGSGIYFMVFYGSGWKKTEKFIVQ
jgi:hypothetical protein